MLGTTSLASEASITLINASGRALTNAAINGGSLEDTLKAALIGAMVDTAHGAAASQIKGLEADYIAHKLAHALAGCAAGAAAGGACQDGAIGAAVGEMVAGIMKKPAVGASKETWEAYNSKVLTTSRLIAGSVAAYAGGNAQTAITAGDVVHAPLCAVPLKPFALGSHMSAARALQGRFFSHANRLSGPVDHGKNYMPATATRAPG